MNSTSRTIEYIGPLNLEEIDWYFRIYLILSNPTEPIEHAQLLLDLRSKVGQLIGHHLSDEFRYIRTGFILAHFGRRGVTYSMWHWADWGGTWEYFCQAWYCYGRVLEEMSALDRNEPILCHVELDVVLREGMVFREMTSRCFDTDALVREYRSYAPAHLAEGMPSKHLFKVG